MKRVFFLFIVLIGVLILNFCVSFNDRSYETYENLSFKDKLKIYFKSPPKRLDYWVPYVDKVLFKEYAKSKGVPCFRTIQGPFKNFDNLKLENIPKDCVIKANNGAGRNIGIKNGKIIFGPYKGNDLKNVWNKLKPIINRWKKPYDRKKQPHYKYIIPKIFVEELIDPIPIDYKVFVFNGTAKMMMVYKDRFSNLKSYLYDTNWNKLDCAFSVRMGNSNLPRPKNLKNIIKTAEKLADGLQFVRVDLYILNGTIFGGEMTFSPAGGRGKFLTKRCSDKFVKYFDGTTTTSDQFNLPLLFRTI